MTVLLTAQQSSHISIPHCFSKTVHPGSAVHSIPYLMGAVALSLVVKSPGLEAGLTSDTEFKKEWGYPSAPSVTIWRSQQPL